MTRPNASDLAAAEAAYAAFADRFDRIHDRDLYVRRLAECAMHKRLFVEHRARLAPKQRRAA